MNIRRATDESPPETDTALIDRIGQLTRTLHESLRELGLDRELERVADAMPDTQARLSYIAETTQRAAERTLSALERARPLQSGLAEQARALETRWDTWFDAPLSQDEARDLVNETRDYLKRVPDDIHATDTELHEIMMAQDFQDLTGQVVARLVELGRRLERELLEVLVENRPDAAARRERPRKTDDDGLLNGPQIDKTQGEDIVSNQSEVDDLLDQLGF